MSSGSTSWTPWCAWPRSRPARPCGPGWTGSWTAPRDEREAVLSALEGRYVPAGPSGSPSRGMWNVLPTGRNFYSVDPQAIPSPPAWETGRRLADALIERYRREHGRHPRTVGLVIWGTAAMRTHGDDVAQALALLGVRPLWRPETGRVTGVEAVPLAELGRPRVDVTVHLSGFFRDAFPHLVDLLDRAVRLVAASGRGAGGGQSRRGARAAGPPPPRGPRHRPPLRQQAGVLRGRAAAPDRLPALGDRGRPGPGLRGLGGLRLRRGAGRGAGQGRLPGPLRRRRGGAQEPGQPGARPLRQRRLLPVPRGHDRRRAGHPGGPARGVLRGQRRPPAPGGAQPARGSPARLPHPRRQPPLARGDAPPRLQGRHGARGDRGLPLRLRRHRWRRLGLDVRDPGPALRPRSAAGRRVPAQQSLGPARRHRPAPRSRLPWPVGRSRVPETLDALRRQYLSVEGDLEASPTPALVASPG